MRHRTRPVAVLGLALASACASVPPVGTPLNQVPPATDAESIAWPARYSPERATFFVHNELEIAAPPEVVWDLLMAAPAWPSWYEGAADVELIDGGDRLHPSAVFRWKTMGFRFESAVKEFDPPRRLSWETRRGTLKGYHAWLLVPTPTGTRVVTDEAQFGLLASLQRLFQPDKLRRLHDRWLLAIRERSGQPPGEVHASVAGSP